MKAASCILTFVIAAVIAGYAQADDNLTVGGFVTVATNDKHMQEWIYFSGQSFLWANEYSAGKGRPRLYCQPDHLALTAQQYVAIMSNYIHRHPETGKANFASFEGLLLNALVDTFPCAE